MKKTVNICLSIIIFIIGFIGCDTDNGTNGNENGETYTVTIGTLTNANGCTITANPTSGKIGIEITLTVNEIGNYRLKTGTLKYGTTEINETTKKFNLPATNVTITAEFELKTDSGNGNTVFSITDIPIIVPLECTDTNFGYLGRGRGDSDDRLISFAFKNSTVTVNNNKLTMTIGEPTKEFMDFINENDLGYGSVKEMVGDPGITITPPDAKMIYFALFNRTSDYVLAYTDDKQTISYFCYAIDDFTVTGTSELSGTTINWNVKKGWNWFIENHDGEKYSIIISNELEMDSFFWEIVYIPME
jgi:hypothetical protein